MADNGWSDFMNSRGARIACDIIVIVACARYAGEAALQLIHPDSEMAALYQQSMGTSGFYALTIGQLVVCSAIVIQFARRMAKDILSGKDER